MVTTYLCNKWVIEAPAEQTLKTQKSFKHLVMEEMSISKKLVPSTKPVNTLDYVEFDINLELIQSINKTKDLPSIVNQIAIETVNTLYPNGLEFTQSDQS